MHGRVAIRLCWCAACAASLFILLAVTPSRAGSAVHWLPESTTAPPLVADPFEPRLSIAAYPADDHLHAVLGGLVPLARLGETMNVTASLDGGAWLELGISGNVFPMETVDGAFGLRVDAAQDFWRVCLRVRHWSAHRADGDSTVVYPPESVSREFITLEAGLHPGAVYAYARGGAAWHAVPETEGLIAAAGIQWLAQSGSWRPLAAFHVEYDPYRGDAPTWSVFAGVETGRRPLRLGLRWWKGPGPLGQDREARIERFGVEFQFAPEAR